MSAERRKNCGIPGAVITDGGEAPNMGIGNQTQVVCKNSVLNV